MASVTNRSNATPASTTGGSSITSAITPAAGELVVLLVLLTGVTSANPPSVTDTTNLGWTLVSAPALKAASADTLWVFVSNQLATGSTTVTVKTAQNATPVSATGSAIFAAGVSGMTRTGIDAIRQFAISSNGAAAGTPAPTFGSAALTGNPIIAFMANATSPATVTPPASSTEQNDVGYATPTAGAEWASRDSGFTGTAVTWGSTSASAWGALALELDTSTGTNTTPYVAAVAAAKIVASGTLTSIAVPAGNANDIFVCLCASADQVAQAINQGFTLKGSAITAGTAQKVSVYWKRSATGTETAPTITRTAGDAAIAVIFIVRGCPTTGDPFEAFGGTATSASTTATAPTQTPTDTPTCVVCAVTDELTGNTSGLPVWGSYTQGTFPQPAMSEILDTATGIGVNNLSLGVAWGGSKTATATGNYTAVVANEGATPTTTIGAMMVFAGAGGGAPPPAVRPQRLNTAERTMRAEVW